MSKSSACNSEMAEWKKQALMHMVLTVTTRVTSLSCGLCLLACLFILFPWLHGCISFLPWSNCISVHSARCPAQISNVDSSCTTKSLNKQKTKNKKKCTEYVLCVTFFFYFFPPVHLFFSFFFLFFFSLKIQADINLFLITVLLALKQPTLTTWSSRCLEEQSVPAEQTN